MASKSDGVVPAIELTKVKGTWFVRNENLLIELDKA
jgi:hypothetical protein